MGTFFISIYNFFNARKWLLWLFTAFLFLSAAFFASKVKLEEDITRVLPQDPKIDRLNQFLQNSKFADKLAVIVSQVDSTAPASPDSLVFAAEQFATGLQGDAFHPYISAVTAKLEDTLLFSLLGRVQANLPLFLEPGDYKTLDSLTSPGRVAATMESNYNTLVSPAGMVLKRSIAADPLGITWIGMKKLQQLQADDAWTLYDGYLMSKDQRNALMLITPKNGPNKTDINKAFLGHLDHWIDSLGASQSHIHISYFGATAVAVGNAVQLRQDTMFTQGITVLLLIVLIALFFRRKRAPLLVMLPVVFGALFSSPWYTWHREASP